MSPIKVKCNVEATKNPKWSRLTPVEKGPIGPVSVHASQLNGQKTITVTLS